MKKKPSPTASAGGVQVFELTMDNPEDQDELNRRLRKPGEPNLCSPPKVGRTTESEPTAKSTGKRTGKRKPKS